MNRRGFLLGGVALLLVPHAPRRTVEPSWMANRGKEATFRRFYAGQCGGKSDFINVILTGVGVTGNRVIEVTALRDGLKAEILGMRGLCQVGDVIQIHGWRENQTRPKSQDLEI